MDPFFPRVSYAFLWYFLIGFFVIVRMRLILNLVELLSKMTLWLSSPVEQPKSMSIYANLFKDCGEPSQTCL